MCLDERSHGTDTLAYERLAQFQGPSLLVFNDSTFKESDFESISRIGDSVKRTQVGKTGRFGVGFNSVYHLTDMPSFVSGRHVVFFDPSCAFLPNVTAANPGKRVDFVVQRRTRGQTPRPVDPVRRVRMRRAIGISRDDVQVPAAHRGTGFDVATVQSALHRAVGPTVADCVCE